MKVFIAGATGAIGRVLVPQLVARGHEVAGMTKADVIKSGGGNDRINGRGGGDRLSGGAGKDRLAGRSGRDRFSGGRGADRLNAVDGRAARAVKGGPGKDRSTPRRSRAKRWSIG